MRLIIPSLILIGCLWSQDSLAQKQIDLEVPAYPATAIIGNPGLEVNRVGNYSALIGSLTSEISPNEATIPTDLALEFVPYYMKSRAGTVEELDQMNILRDLRISLATSRVAQTNSSSSYPRVGVGFRSYVLPGKIEKSLIYDQNALATTPARLRALAANIRTNSIFDVSMLYHSANNPNGLKVRYADEVAKRIENIPPGNTSEVADKLVEIADEITRSIQQDPSSELNIYNMKNRTGSILEISGAMAVDFPQGDVGYQEINRWGVWLGYHWIPQNSNNQEFSLLGRFSNYSYDPASKTSDNYYFDLGGNISLPVVTDRFVVTLEYIYRNNTTADADEAKANVTLSYALSEQALFQITYDKFEGRWETGDVDPSQLLLGVVYALGGG